MGKIVVTEFVSLDGVMEGPAGDDGFVRGAWSFEAERGEEGADRVGVAGTAGDERDAGFAGQAAVGVGHVDGCGLVADMDEIEIGVERRVEDRHDVVAGQREHAVAAEPLKRSGNDVGAA